MSLNNPSYHRPHVTHVHVPSEPPPGVPSPSTPVPIDPELLKYQERRWREANWSASEAPIVAVLSGLISLAASSYLNFKALSAIGNFEPDSWFGYAIGGFFFGLMVGSLISALVVAAVTLIVYALSWLFTGKGIDMQPGPMDQLDPFEAIMFGASFFGIFVGEALWIVAGIKAGAQ